MAVVLDVGNRELARRPRLLDLHLELVETFGQRVRAHAPQDERAIFNGDIELELAGVPALGPPNAVHAFACRGARRVERDADSALDRIGLVELDATSQLTLERKRLAVPPESNLDVFVHDGLEWRAPHAEEAECAEIIQRGDRRDRRGRCHGYAALCAVRRSEMAITSTLDLT